MKSSDAIRALNDIRKEFSRILDPTDAERVLEDARAQIEVSAEYYETALDRGTQHPNPWGYEIAQERPLRFIDSKVRGYTLRVDLCCEIRWGDDSLPVRQDLAVRVWSSDRRVVFREKFDSEEVRRHIDEHGRRVMSRLHFDRANAGQLGPAYHMQIVLKRLENEC